MLRKLPLLIFITLVWTSQTFPSAQQAADFLSTLSRTSALDAKLVSDYPDFVVIYPEEICCTAGPNQGFCQVCPRRVPRN